MIAILGIIAAIILPSVTESAYTAKQRVNEHTAATLNSAIERYYLDNEIWPTNLSVLVPAYLPEGVPTNPVDETPYFIDPESHRVRGTGL